MNNYWFNKLLDVLMVQTNSQNEKLMVLYLDKELKRLKLSYDIDAAGNVIVTKGVSKTYPCVTSHMDTVHNFAHNFNIYKDIDNNDLLFAGDNKRRVGIGGDDKCGIFACLYLLETIPQIKVIFFSREEIGCKGSTEIDKKIFADCRYLIQLDRKGSKDFIQTYWGDKTVSHEFSSEIGLIKKKYEYKNQTGTVTDVMKLWKSKVGISCINLSCGYYKPHTDYEYISVNALWKSVKFTEEIINNMKPKRYVSLPPPITTPAISAYSGIANNAKKVYLKCCKCKIWKNEVLLVDFGKNKKICWSCKNKEDKKVEKSNNKDSIDYSTLQNGETILFACFECGMTTDQMEKGHSLKYAKDGHLYCNKCMSILFSSNNKPLICEICNKTIPKNHYHTFVDGMLVCGACAVVLDASAVDDSPKKCFSCNKIIPKDHKIIERFGVRVCEDCALPSDIETHPS